MITRKELTEMYGDRIYVIDGRKLEAFLSLCGMKIGYNSGEYGWNWNAFDVAHEACLIYGYRNFIGKSLDSDLTDKYEKKAAKLFSDFKMNYYEKKKKADALALKFIKEIEK